MPGRLRERRSKFPLYRKARVNEFDIRWHPEEEEEKEKEEEAKLVSTWCVERGILKLGPAKFRAHACTAASVQCMIEAFTIHVMPPPAGFFPASLLWSNVARGN